MYKFIIYILIFLVIITGCAKNPKETIFDKFEINHYIKDKTFYYSSLFYKLNAHIYDYEHADMELIIIGNRHYNIKIEEDNIEVKPAYTSDLFKESKYYPAILISDINYLKKFGIVSKDNTFVIVKDDFTISFKHIVKFGEYYFYKNITLKPASSFMSFQMTLDSVK